MTDQTDADEFNTPDDRPCSGHAAVGYVTGQRHDDGSVPEKVRIKYARHGDEREAEVFRPSGTVVRAKTDTVRFHQPRSGSEKSGVTLYVDHLLAARPVADD